MKIRSVAVVGSGNVAWHLSKILLSKQVELIHVCGKDKDKAIRFASELGIKKSIDLSSIPESVQLVILCVSDSSIAVVASKLQHTHKIVVHTAGSVGLNVLSAKLKHCGVIYPYQTFTKNIPLGNENFPICIEAEGKGTQEDLIDFSKNISNIVIPMDTATRAKLHLAGVIANNFSNFLYNQAYNYLQNNNIPSKLLDPLIEQTVKKLAYAHPDQLQTGPAARGDKLTLERHKELLSSEVGLKELYSLISDKIYTYYNSKHK